VAAVRGFVFGFAPADIFRAGRTERSLSAAGVEISFPPALSLREIAKRLNTAETPLLLVCAGAWLAHTLSRLSTFPNSATKNPLIGFGAVRGFTGMAAVHHPRAVAWRRMLAHTGGDLDRLAFWRELPEPMSLWLEPASAAALAALLLGGLTWPAALRSLVRDREFRAVHLPLLDVHEDSALRVIQLVTTIQIGGAERVTLDLAEELPRRGIRVCVASLGAPTRTSFPEPANFVDLSRVENTPHARAQAVATLTREFAADLVHAHLIQGAEARAIKSLGVPLVMTVHNMPRAWPIGLAEADMQTADLLFACSRAVERTLAQCRFGIPIRTVWNGIDPGRVALTLARATTGTALRQAVGWSTNDFVLAVVANPRPQKRLERLPEIIHHLAQRLRAARRDVRLLLVGAPARGNVDATQSIAALEAEIARWQIHDRVHWTGAVSDIGSVLAASDAFISVSAFEGLSLAQLEALAAGVPVVATDVGGAGEIAQQSNAFHLIPASGDVSRFAEVLAAIANDPAHTRESALPRSFTRHAMAARAAQLYPVAIARSRPTPSAEAVWLITNNFSTGGAQSSARRLLTGLAQRRGVKVRAFTVEEPLRWPTEGSKALLRAGVPVTAIAPPHDGNATGAVAQIIAQAAIAPPCAVLFWNLIASYKVLLVDALADAVPVYDVSPGEMYYTSLLRYFENPRAGLPYLELQDYGARLSGVVVKYHAEMERARALLRTPVHVIANGVPLSEFPIPRRDLQKKDRIIFGTAARISPDKHLEDLITAFCVAQSRLPDFKLCIAGRVERGAEAYARNLRRLARGLPVEWVGELADTSAFLAGLDVFTMISEPAGCPNASLEAMAAGLPVIATDFGGASEQVLDGITGRLAPRGDAQSFAEALIELSRDRSRRASFGFAGRERIRLHFSVERMLEGYHQLCLRKSLPMGTWSNREATTGVEINLPARMSGTLAW
jgi:glycosyltransferase involved in cell wall biosynthesis